MNIPMVHDSTGTFAFNVDSLAVAYTWNSDGTLANETRGPDRVGNSYKKTYGYTNGQLTSESGWVKQ